MIEDEPKISKHSRTAAQPISTLTEPHIGKTSVTAQPRAVDFVLVTALEEERDAVLDRLPGYRKLPPSEEDIRIYFEADLPVTFPDDQTGVYQVIVMSLLGMGRVHAVMAAADAIRRWHPRYIILIGIAGGIAERGVKIGDILISDQIVDYELQKITPLGHEVRWEVQRADPRLLNAYKNFMEENWQEQIQTKRPGSGKPQCHAGPIASGDKVIAFNQVLTQYRDVWPKLIGVEMEAAGVATATFQSPEKPGFFMVRCVSDLADEQKGSASVKKWRPYACEAAASFAIALLKSGPVSPNENTKVIEGNELLPYTHRPERLRSPFIYGHPVKGDEFVNRQETLRSVFNRLRNSESVVVTGEPHIGKTSFLQQLSDPQAQRAYVDETTLRRWTFSFVSLHDLPLAYTPYEFWDDALKPIQEHPGSKATSQRLKEAHEKQYDRFYIRRLFSNLSSQNRNLVLLLDEFECLFDHDNVRSAYFYALLHALSTEVGGLVLVLGSRLPQSKLSKTAYSFGGRGSPYFNLAINQELPPFGRSSIESLLDRASPSFSSEEKTFIQRVAGRNPYLLQAMASTLYETPRSENRTEEAAEKFFQRVGHHFGDLWDHLDDATRTAAVILSLKTLDGRTIGSSYNYGEIENAGRFSRELRTLAKRGLAELVGQSSKGWVFDSEHLLLWRGEKWALTCEAFAWWIRDEIIAPTHEIPSLSKWLTDHRYLNLITQEQWDGIQETISRMPSWAISGVAGIARVLWNEVCKSRQ